MMLRSPFSRRAFRVALLVGTVFAGFEQDGPYAQDQEKGSPTCGPPWGSVISTLTYLSVSDSKALICAQLLYDPPKTHYPERCTELDFSSGTFSEVTKPSSTVSDSALQVTDKLSVCKGQNCVPLEVDAAELKEIEYGGLGTDVNPAGSLALVALPKEKKVAVFDATTGKRVKTLSPATRDFQCVQDAFFIGDAVYATANRCDDSFAAQAWIFSGKERLPAKLFDLSDNTRGSARPRVLVEGDEWVVASMVPYRIDFIDGRSGKRRASVALPDLDFDQNAASRNPKYCGGCQLALGLTVFSTLPYRPSPLARTPGGSIIAVSSRGMAMVDPKSLKTRLWQFPKCPEK